MVNYNLTVHVDSKIIIHQMKKRLGNVMLFILLLAQIGACQNHRKMTAEAKANQEEYNRPNGIWPTNKDEKGDYYYSVSLNSFPGYVSENAGSHFVTRKEQVVFLAMENGSWTKTTGAVLNDEYHPVPDSLYVRWFSVSEDKFYEGTFKMPSEIIKKHFDEIWLTYASPRIKSQAAKHERFEDLIVGVTPGGGVMVWMKSQSQQIEIGCYQAKEIQMDWDKFAGLNGFGAGTTRQAYSTRRKVDVTLHIPFGRAEKYRAKFIWKCGFEANSNLFITSYELYFYNGEMENLYRNYKDGINEFKERAVPSRLNFIVQEKDKKLYNFEIYFNEDDIYKAFHTICTTKNTEARLVLQLDKDHKVSKIALRNKTHEFVLNPKKVQLFSDKFDSRVLPLADH